MSKIFEALKKAGGIGGDLPLPLFAEEPAQALQPASLEEPEYLPPTEPPVSTATPAPPPLPPATAAGPQARSLPIRLSPAAPLLPFDGSHARAGEQYRIIRTRILQHPQQPTMMVVSSAGPGDGKTVSALNLAGALALKNDINVLLVDADFRRSSIAAMLGIPSGPGLADLLHGSCPLEDAVVRAEQLPNLYVLPAGRNRFNPTELLDSPSWKEACEGFRKKFRFTIVDAPPIAAVADYDLIQVVCDGVIVVVRPDHTNRTLCTTALQMVPPEKMLGALINCYSEWFLWKHHDFDYHSGAESQPCIQT